MINPIIKFSFRYKKMPDGVEYLHTYVKSADLVDYKELTPEQINQDTETVDGQFYPLPHDTLIRIGLWSETITGGVEWATMRRFTPWKFEYYRKLLGQEVNIEIKKI